MRRAHGGLLCGRGRAAGENALAARRLADAAGVERAEDGQRLHNAGRGKRRVGAMVGEGVVHAGSARPIHQRQADGVRARRDPLPERARVGDFERLAVERDVDGRYREAAGSAAGDREVVLRVQRESMRHQQAAARAERQALDVLVVHPLARGRIRDLRRRRRAVADRAPADLQGRRHVALHQRRRHRQRLGDVVEAFARVVAGQQRAHVHVHRQQIADRVGVLGAVETLEGRRVEVASGRVRGIELAFERGGERRHRRGIRPRHANRRHHAGAQLADHLLPHLDVGADVRQAVGLERKAAGLGARVVAGDAVLGQERGSGAGAVEARTGRIDAGATGAGA